MDLEFAAYADDQIIHIPTHRITNNQMQDIQNIIEKINSMYYEIGLQLNLNKCNSTFIPEVNFNNPQEISNYFHQNPLKKPPEIEFMGVKYDALQKQIPLAPKLKDTISKEIIFLEALLAQNVERNVIYQMLIKSSISKITYGPFIDN